MPPSAHTLATMMTTKPKIGFSIDSIVGNRNHRENKSPINFSHDSEGSEAPLSPLSDYSYQHHNNHSPKSHHDIATALKLNEYAQLELRNKMKRSLSTSPSPPHHHDKMSMHRLVEQDSEIQRHEIQKLPIESQARLLSSDDMANRRSQSPQSPTPQQTHIQKPPIIVPGIPASILRPNMQSHGQQLPPTISAEMMAAQNPFFRLVTFLLPPT